jgi:hypothetical protein
VVVAIRRLVPVALRRSAVAGVVVPGAAANNPVLVQRRLVVGKQQQVVHIADIAFDPQSLLELVIQLAEIEIGEVLAAQVTDGQPATGGGIGWAMGNDPIQQGQHRRLPEQPRQQAPQHRLIDRREKPAYIALQHILIATGELLRAGDGRMSALAAAAGVAVEDRAALKDGFQHIAQSVRQQPVPDPKWRRTATG